MIDCSRIYEEIFYIDGSLRDIYVLGTNDQDWQVLLDFLRLEIYPIEYIIGGKLQPLPERIEGIFTRSIHDDVINLQIDEAHLALHCHFFTSTEIECDLDPRDFHNEQQVVRLIEFIRTIGRLLNKEIVLTIENMREWVLFRFDAVAGKEEWCWEGIHHQE